MAKSPVNQLKVALRTETGKGASRRARREGKIPAVLYGHGTESRHLELPGHDYAAVLRHAGTNAVLTLDIEGNEELALTKALDIHPIRRTIQHADLVIVRRGQKVVVDVHVEIEADVSSIPERLTVSIEDAEPGTQITAGQIALPRGVNLVSDPELLVVNVVNAPTEEDLAEEGAGEAAEGEGAEEAEAETETEAAAEESE